MNIYDCFGTFDPTSQSFNLAIQTTNIGFDEFFVSQYYNISNPNRYAIVAILQTKGKNDMDMSPCKPNAGLIEYEISFDRLIDFDKQPEDLIINEIAKGKVIEVYTWHAIGFSLSNNYDKRFIEQMKSNSFPIVTKGSPPSAGGKGILI